MDRWVIVGKMKFLFAVALIMAVGYFLVRLAFLREQVADEELGRVVNSLYTVGEKP